MKTFRSKNKKDCTWNLDEPSGFWGKVLYGALVILMFALAYVGIIGAFALTPYTY